MSTRCKPGDLCVVIKSDFRNAGMFVTVLRWVRKGEAIPQWKRAATVRDGVVIVAFEDGWLVKAAAPMRPGPPGNKYIKSSRFGVFADSALQPIKPPSVDSRTADTAPVEEALA